MRPPRAKYATHSSNTDKSSTCRADSNVISQFMAGARAPGRRCRRRCRGARAENALTSGVLRRQGPDTCSPTLRCYHRFLWSRLAGVPPADQRKHQERSSGGSGLVDGGGAVPVAQGPAVFEECSDRCVTVERDVSVVEVDDGFEQGLGFWHVADVLAVGVGVADEVLAGGVLGERGRPHPPWRG